MKKVYGSHDNLIIGHLKEVLEQQGIACLLRNGPLLGAAGELPPNECWPEIWVLDDTLWARARGIVDEVLQGEAAGPAWRCPGCGEELEGQFTACWRCGRPRPGPDGDAGA